MAQPEKTRVQNEAEKRKCVCCGRSPSYVDLITGDPFVGNYDKGEFWYLCELHKSEKRRVGLIQFAAWHPRAILELRQRGLPGAVQQAQAIQVEEIYPWF